MVFGRIYLEEIEMRACHDVMKKRRGIVKKLRGREINLNMMILMITIVLNPLFKFNSKMCGFGFGVV